MGLLVPVLLFASAGYTVTQDLALRSGCGTSDDIVAKVQQGDPVEIRFAMSGEVGTCYKVAVTSAGKSYQGYLPASALTGLEQFERSRQTAASVDTPAAVKRDMEAAGKTPIVIQGSQKAARAMQLLESNQPEEALRQLEQAIKTSPKDAGLLAIAGMAAYRSDRIPDAIHYWQDSLALSPNEPVEHLLARARREASADQSSEKLYGSRFALRFNPAEVTPEQAHQLVPVLESEFARVSEQLGCRTEERIVTVIQSREAYLKTTGAAEWSGGTYDGRIHVALLEPQPGPMTRRTFAHEIVHACLARLGDWPAWLHEGLAQKLSGEQLPPQQREAVYRAGAARKLPSLSQLGHTYSGMNAEGAMVAYSLSLVAVETLYQAYGPDGVRSLLQSPERLGQVTQDLDRRLSQSQ